ncbi:O-antigen polymerase [Nocardioides sp. CF8]|uniref:O-antigen polymerase n=1 Tax=Nocardioides sp. CF8 TaxID=110319 RepID=UPI0018DCB426|nr:O-antigen polymerase [Nocardioides sp. CF8]
MSGPRVMPTLVALLAAGLALSALSQADTPPAVKSALVASTLVLAAGLALSVRVLITSGDAFASRVFPLAYTCACLLGPAIYAATGGFGPYFLKPSQLTVTSVAALTIFVASLAAGLWVPVPGRAKKTSPPHRQVVGTRLPFATRQTLFRIALALLLVAAALRLAHLVMFGPGSFNTFNGFGATWQITAFRYASLLPLPAVMLLLIAVRRPLATLVPPSALALLGIWGITSLIIGTRDELLAPTIVLLWAYHHRIKRIPIGKLAAVACAGFLALAIVGLLRTGTAMNPISAILRPVASATNTSTLAVNAIPSQSQHLYGETYLVAMMHALPVVPIDLDDHPTATHRFPDVINHTAQSGLGFSPVAEAWWNFGWLGLVTIPLLFAFMLRMAEMKAHAWPVQATCLAYPLIISRIPVMLRGDFLQQYKGILVPLLAVGLVVFVTSWASYRRSGQTGSRSAKGRSST